MKYDVASAKKCAADGQVEAWVHAYLVEGDWANPGLSEGLKLQTRYWAGPIEMALDDLVRTCGPEPDMPFPVDPAGWELKVTLLARNRVPPTCRRSSLSIFKESCMSATAIIATRLYGVTGQTAVGC